MSRLEIAKDMIGKTYGNRTVISLDDESDEVRVICKCKCGRESSQDIYYITSHPERKCRWCAYGLDEKNLSKTLLASYRYGAKKRNIVFEIDVDISIPVHSKCLSDGRENERHGYSNKL